VTESSAIIPVVPDNEAIGELVDQKNLFTQIELVQLRLEDLQALQRTWFDWAQKLNLILIIKLLAKQDGQLNQERGRTIWQANNGDGLINISLENASNVVEVRVEGNLVCSDAKLGEEVFVPGQWVLAVVDAFRRKEIEKSRQAAANDTRARQEMIERLGANV
jgi:hypothetical protein